MLSGGPDEDLLPAGVRPPAAVAVLLAAGTVAMLAVRFAGTGREAMGGLDRALMQPVIIGWSPLEILTWIGAPATVVTIAVVSAVVAFRQGRRRLAVLAVLGPGITGLATTALKPVVGRSVIDGGMAYPSGHTAGATALGLLAAIALIGALRPGRAGAAALLASSVVPAAVAGGGMVLTGAHYPTDVVGGYATAVAVTLGTALVLDGLTRWRVGRT